MTTETQTQQQDPPTWGTPPAPSAPGPGRWSKRRTAAAVGIAAAIALGGGAAVYATTSSSDSGTTTAQGPGGAPPAGGQGGGPMGGSTALHGTYTVADDSGTGFHTELTQTGEVTAVSTTSITVVSDDDYAKTYTVDAGTVVQAMSAGAPNSSSTLTIGDLAKGDEVTVTAEVSGSTATVDTVMERQS